MQRRQPLWPVTSVCCYFAYHMAGISQWARANFFVAPQPISAKNMESSKTVKFRNTRGFGVRKRRINKKGADRRSQKGGYIYIWQILVVKIICISLVFKLNQHNVVNSDRCFRVTVRWLSNLCVQFPIVNIHEMQSFRWAVHTMQRH